MNQTNGTSGAGDNQIESFLHEVLAETEMAGNVPEPTIDTGRPSEAEMHALTVSFWRAEVTHLKAQAVRARRLGLDSTAKKIEAVIPSAEKTLQQAEGFPI